MARLYGGGGGGGGGTITGSGVAGQVTYWDGATSIAGNAKFLHNVTNTTLLVATNSAFNPGCTDSIIVGNTCTMGVGNYNALFGVGTTMNGSGNIMSGYGAGAEVNGSYNARFGYINAVTGDYNLNCGRTGPIIGHYNIQSGLSCSTGGSYNAVFGNAHTMLGNWNIVAGGSHDIATEDYCAVFGAGHRILSSYATAVGNAAQTINDGQMAHANGGFNLAGDSQTSVLVARKETTDDTADVELALDGATNYLATQDDKAYAFVVTITAKDTGSTDHAMYRLEWSTVRGTGVGSVTVDGLVKTVIFESQAAWDVTVTADLTNGRPVIGVTGVAATTIHWVARIEMTEVK